MFYPAFENVEQMLHPGSVLPIPPVSHNSVGVRRRAVGNPRQRRLTVRCMPSLLTSNSYFFERKILKQINLVDYDMTIEWEVPHSWKDHWCR